MEQARWNAHAISKVAVMNRLALVIGTAALILFAIVVWLPLRLCGEAARRLENVIGA